ncbi:serine/threonine-protein kinase [Spirillospora sp. CA-128828]|uniref:serine/threonine-protein kinase n=1 Tax=Spirillospora sp. CA-128828 TaxID=3240033 RepID=UPI003D9113F9
MTALGAGGMGVVYRATDQHGHQYALKLLKPELAEHATFHRRLAREVDTMRRVRSPHVAEVIDADVTAERPYIVTRFIDGQPLDTVVQAIGPLHTELLLRLSAGLAEGLVAIHEAEIVHRDVKPNNVMLVDGDPVLIDFGIAHATDATRLTQTGMFIGTPGYLGPEVIEGKPPGPAVDIYGWAATVAFAATGRSPFGTGSLHAVLARAISGEPDVEGVPPQLEPQLKAALARDPRDRPSATQIAAWARRGHAAAPALPTALTPADQADSTTPTAIAVDFGPVAGHPSPDWPAPKAARSPTAVRSAKTPGSSAEHRSSANAAPPARPAVAAERTTAAHRRPTRRRKPPSRYPRKTISTAHIALTLVATAWIFWKLTPAPSGYLPIDGPSGYMHILWFKILSLIPG